MSELFHVEVDRAEFLASIRTLLEGTELWKQLSGALTVDWKQPGETAKTLALLVSNVIAAVEVAKHRLIEQADPDGSKGLTFDGMTALEAAVTLLDEALVFRGAVGTIVDLVDRPLLVFLIETAFAARKGANWLTVAKGLLALA